jgi:hypothetical protein
MESIDIFVLSFRKEAFELSLLSNLEDILSRCNDEEDETDFVLEDGLREEYFLL